MEGVSGSERVEDSEQRGVSLTVDVRWLILHGVTSFFYTDLGTNPFHSESFWFIPKFHHAFCSYTYLFLLLTRAAWKQEYNDWSGILWYISYLYHMYHMYHIVVLHVWYLLNSLFFIFFIFFLDFEIIFLGGWWGKKSMYFAYFWWSKFDLDIIKVHIKTFPRTFDYPSFAWILLKSIWKIWLFDLWWPWITLIFKTNIISFMAMKFPFQRYIICIYSFFIFREPAG